MMLLSRSHSAARTAFTFADLLLTLAALALLAAIAVPMSLKNRARTRESVCLSNVGQVNRAMLAFVNDNGGHFPEQDPALKGPVWWFYKELVKGHLGLRGPSSPADKVFGCPDDRGYDEPKPFRLSARFDYNSYTYNGVAVPGVPSLVGRQLSSVREPSRTLLVMEWAAHAPLSWHRSRTGRKNHPFYNDAESVVGFVDGHVDIIQIHYDGMNAAYTRDPIPGYRYKYGAD
jgi:hypothetical protein